MRQVTVMIVILLSLFFAGCRSESGRVELVAMEVGSELTGSFFLLSGSIGETEYFYAWIKAPNGGMYRIHTLVSRATVYETDQQPYAEYKTDWGILSKPGYMVTYDADWNYYIPRGSIVPSFDMMRSDQ